MKQKHNSPVVPAVRTEKPSDEVKNAVKWTPGMKPKGGYQAVQSYGPGFGTTKPEPGRKVCKGA
jgi:hypothetical protein